MSLEAPTVRPRRLSHGLFLGTTNRSRSLQLGDIDDQMERGVLQGGKENAVEMFVSERIAGSSRQVWGRERNSVTDGTVHEGKSTV